LPSSTTAVPDVEGAVLEVVDTLCAELAGSSRRATLDDSLDRDLGISSLERVELLLRLEQTLGVRLPDSVMAEAATPRELVRAILAAGPARAPAPRNFREAASPATFIPATARTLIDALRGHADHTPDRVHIYLHNDDGSETGVTYGELLRAATAAARGLRRLGVNHGDRVALMLRTERGFFDAFFGTLLAGAVPVPLYPPVRADDLVAYTRRQQTILRNAGARVLVTFAEVERLTGLMRSQVPSLEAIATPNGLARDSDQADAADPRLRAEEGALIQYTSGSTGDPKGVLLSHANLLANIRAIGDAIRVRPDDVVVSWLPLYHDMGLIGAWLGSLYFGLPVALMSPLAFLSRPARWLTTIAAQSGTISPAPNFAFDVCVRKIRDEEIQGLDLRRWRLALNGSEAVSPETIGRFTQRFEPYGFRAEAMCPVYGLAESSVGLSASPIERLPRVDRIAREPFERLRQVRAAAPDGPRSLAFVSCGHPLPGHDIRIVDASGRPLGERAEGHIEFRGPSVTHGYFNNPEATRAVMHDDWMDSGDLGYWADGELFVTGREKDLIIQAGRNISPQEVEAIAAEVAGVRKGCVAAFGVRDSSRGTERFVVVAETRERDQARRDALQRAVRDRIVDGVGAPPDIVVIAEPRTVLKTPSGKIRRRAMRDAYVAGTLGARESAILQSARLVAADLQARSERGVSRLGRGIFTAWIAGVVLISAPLLWMYMAPRSPGRLANRAAKRWSRFVLAACGVRPRVTGLENVSGVRTGILVANHASYIDAIVMMAAIPAEFHFIAKRALTRYPLIGTVIKKAEHLTIEKARMIERLAGADTLASRLRQGDLLMVFPEGTFAQSPGLLPFRLGAFRAAVDAGRPVVPIAIRGTRQVLPDGTWLFRRAPIVVTIGAPIYPQAQGWPEMVRLRDRSVDEIARSSGEPATR